jgi:hypothetical protein
MVLDNYCGNKCWYRVYGFWKNIKEKSVGVSGCSRLSLFRIVMGISGSSRLSMVFGI